LRSPAGGLSEDSARAPTHTALPRGKVGARRRGPLAISWCWPLGPAPFS
jgi:hypothetical protein